MKVTGTYIFDAPRARVWARIHNPGSLMSIIPGCRHIDKINPTEYRGQIQLKLPAIVGMFQTYVKLTEVSEPEYCAFSGEISGSPGAIKGTVVFRLRETSNQTTIKYQGQGLITGPLSRLNDRFVAGLAKSLINQGLTRLNEQLQPVER